MKEKNIYRKITKLTLMLVITLSCLVSSVNGQELQDLESKLFTKLIKYQFNQTEIDSLNLTLQGIQNNLEELRKNSNENKDEIISVMSSSVSITNRLRDLRKEQKEADSEISVLKQVMYDLYNARIDSLKKVQPDSDNMFVQQDILNYTEKKLLVQPKLGVLSIDPLKLLNLSSDRNEPLTKTIVQEYFTEAISEVDSHLAVIDKSLDEVEEIVQLSKLTENFLEETSLESETRSMSLFSFSDEAKSLTDDGTGAYEEIRNQPEATSNTTLLGANTFATILEQLSAYNTEIRKSTYENKFSSKTDISIEDYNELLRETKKRLEEYRTSLTKKADWLNE